jgi:hypothetical protein
MASVERSWQSLIVERTVYVNDSVLRWDETKVDDVRGRPENVVCLEGLPVVVLEFRFDVIKILSFHKTDSREVDSKSCRGRERLVHSHLGHYCLEGVARECSVEEAKPIVESLGKGMRQSWIQKNSQQRTWTAPSKAEQNHGAQTSP